MGHARGRTPLLVLLLLAVVAGAWAVDVGGPYNNAQSAVEYTTSNQNVQWLYAVNAKDRSRMSITGETFDLFSRMEGNSGSWTQYRFASDQPGNHPLYDALNYPHILGHNDAMLGGDHVCMVTGTYLGMNVIGQTKSASNLGNGTLWTSRSPLASGSETRYTRLAVSRTRPRFNGWDVVSSRRMIGMNCSRLLTGGQPKTISAIRMSISCQPRHRFIR